RLRHFRNYGGGFDLHDPAEVPPRAAALSVLGLSGGAGAVRPRNGPRVREHVHERQRPDGGVRGHGLRRRGRGGLSAVAAAKGTARTGGLTGVQLTAVELYHLTPSRKPSSADMEKQKSCGESAAMLAPTGSMG